MRSTKGRIKLKIDKLERLKYKTERRIDNLKRNIVDLSNLIEAGRKQLLDEEKESE